MPTVTWITPALAEAVHDRLAVEHGGVGGARHAQALADALSAVSGSAGRGRPDLFALAAAYAAEIAARRPFHGGNVRSAYAICRTFLALNGVELSAAKVDRVLATRQLAAGQIDRAAFAGLLANREPTSSIKPSAGATAGRPSSPVPVRRSAMAYDYQCSRCGGQVAEPGAVGSTGGMYFRPTNAKFLTLKTGDIRLRANACTQCGHVDLVADVDKLSALTRRAEPV
jgi:death-on-curing protein